MNELNIIPQVESMLQIPATGIATSDEQVPNHGVTTLFVIAGLTRSMLYRYATISSAGNVSFHAMAPFSFVDQRQREAQYRKKTTWVSVNMDAQQNPNNPKQYFNNNFGNLLMVLKPQMDNKPNPYNAINLHATRLKQAIIPADIDPSLMNTLNEPVLELQREIQLNATSGLETKEIVELNIKAYNAYADKVLALVNGNLLTYAFALINPKANTVSPSINLEESMKAASNPWMNINKVINSGLPISQIPVFNQYEAVVQIVDVKDLSCLYSDNMEMFGERLVYQNNDTGLQMRAITKVAVIKDYNADTYVLLSITDPANTRPNTRTRTQAFEDLLDKGINTFTVRGSLSPVVRTKSSNAARNGNVIFELAVDEYSIFQSNNIRNSIDTDSFADLDFTETEGDFDVAAEYIDVQAVDLTSDASDSTSNTDSNSSHNDMI